MGRWRCSSASRTRTKPCGWPTIRATGWADQCSRLTSRTASVAKRIDTGMVSINHPTRLKADLPFGGIKISGYGHELAKAGIQEFVNKKLINVVPIDAPA